MDDNIIGFKDMHQSQIDELMNFLCSSLDWAMALSEVLEEEEIFSEAKNKVESLIEMFGGNALIVQTSLESSDLEQG
jgi:hypothetical protein